MQQPFPAEQELPTPDMVRGYQPRITVTMEVIAYLIVIAFSLLLRLAELSAVPLSHTEAPFALNAWRAVSAEAPGDPTITSSPILYAAQSISFGLLGASETSARIMTAIAGVLIVLLPAFFRDRVGRSRAFAITLLLAVSPVLFAASRFSSPVVWSVLAAGFMLWGGSRFVTSRQQSYGIVALTALGVLVFLCEPGGLVLFIVIALAAVIALVSGGSREAEYNYELEGDPFLNESPEIENERSLLASFPYGIGALVAGLFVIGISTAFITNPAGLSNIGEVIAATVRGFSPENGGEVPAMPLIISLFYEPFVWIFALVGLIITLRRGVLRFETRFFVVWIALAALTSFLFRAGGPDHALWFIIPLAGLASRAIIGMFELDREAKMFRIPAWGRYVVMAAMVAILAVLTIAFQDVARSLVMSGSLETANIDPASIVLLIIPILFTIITFFMVASVWDDRTAARGFGLGLLVFTIVASIGSGWRIAVEAADKPAELWHTQAVSRDVFLLRETLLELGRRQSGGFLEVPVMAQTSPNGVVAWILRDFTNAQFISDPSQAVNAEIVLLPAQGTAGDEPDPGLGGSYVGQDFIISRAWSVNTMQVYDLPALWTQRRTRIEETGAERLILWLRFDVYEGSDLDEPGTG